MSLFLSFNLGFSLFSDPDLLLYYPVLASASDAYPDDCCSTYDYEHSHQYEQYQWYHSKERVFSWWILSFYFYYESLISHLLLVSYIYLNSVDELNREGNCSI